MCLSEGLTNTYIIVETRKKKRNNDTKSFEKIRKKIVCFGIKLPLSAYTEG
jgi:hypothetical protein